MTYRDDDGHAARANALIDEIAELERQKVAQATADAQLEAAKRALATLQLTPPARVPRAPAVLTHVLVSTATATAAYVGYLLLI